MNDWVILLTLVNSIAISIHAILFIIFLLIFLKLIKRGKAE